MLNTRHKLAPRRRGGNHYERAIIVAIGFPTSGGSSPGDWSRRLTMPRHRHGNFPTAGINFRARLVRLHARPYAGVKASLLPLSLSRRLFAGIEEGRERRRAKSMFRETPGTSCTNFRPISSCNAERAKNSNGVRWENSLHRVNPFCWPPPRFRSYSKIPGSREIREV